MALLVLTVVGSCLIVSAYSLMPVEADYNKDYDLLKLLLPGVLFSVFIVSLRRKVLSLKRSLVHLVLLVFGYYINLLIDFASWGIAVPLSGLLGGALLSYILEDPRVFQANKAGSLVARGFVSGLIGIIIYYTSPEEWRDPYGFASIIGIWQAVVGWEFIQQLQAIEAEIKDA